MVLAEPPIKCPAISHLISKYLMDDTFFSGGGATDLAAAELISMAAVCGQVNQPAAAPPQKIDSWKE